MPKVAFVVERITPEIAKEYMKHNTKNPRQRVSRSVVKAYADDMKNGRWQLNGEAIVFDEDGYLKNGQHRLLAVIMSGATVEMAVVRGISRENNKFDGQWRRTVDQELTADGIDVNPSVTAAAGIIVNKFLRIRSNGAVKEYIKAHVDELQRAYRITCYGDNKRSKNACCIAATYLMIRTQTMPHYEIELFFRLFNDYGYTSADGYEPGPALVARSMIDDRGNRNGYQIQKEKVEILIMALNDFHKNKKREMKYKISEPFQFMELLDKVRKEDGLNDNA